MKPILLITILLLIAVFSSAQNQVVTRITEDLLESLGENLGDESDVQEILDELEQYRQSPLNLNTATYDDLLKLPLLSENQARNLLAYRDKTGTIYSIFELTAVDGFNVELLQNLEPFVRFDEDLGTSAKHFGSTDILTRATRSFSTEPSDQSKYEGSSERWYLRIKHRLDRIEFGYVGEKDPGEAFFKSSNKYGFDYNSAFANFRIGKNENRLFVGDYHVRFGQGLVAWQGFSMGKSAETTQVSRTQQGIRSYSSTDENQFFRGMSGRFQWRQLLFYPFVSIHKLDANVDTLNRKSFFGAFQTSGYHRTGSEIDNERSVSQVVSGGHITYSFGQWAFGTTLVYTRFNAYMDRSDDSYNQFLPEGNGFVAGSFDWKGTYRKLYFFGETAFSGNSGKAIVAGIMTKPAQNAELSIVYRNFGKTYYSFFSNAFSESSRINDEQGLYLGLKIYPAAHWTLQGYADLFRHRWLKYTTAAPSEGNEFLLQVSYSRSRTTSYYLRYFQEDKDQRLIDGRLRYNESQLIRRIRLNFSRDLSEQFGIKSRIEFSTYSKVSAENGMVILQDFDFKPLNKAFALNGRLAYFSTDGYNSRLYAYENDLLYSFSVPALYNKGFRCYFNYRKDLNERLSFWLKLAATHQLKSIDDNGETVGAATKTEVKIQLRYQF